MQGSRRKQIKHYHEPGDIHEFTFSCYCRKPLLTNNAWRANLSECIDAVFDELGCFLAAFVYMPEHVHLLVWGIRDQKDIGTLLGKVKQPMSSSVHADLARTQSPLLKKLTVRERPGKMVFRYWQEGPGYDRNRSPYVPCKSQSTTSTGIRSSEGCVREPPTGGGRVPDYYESNGQFIDPLLPTIAPLPREYWLGK